MSPRPTERATSTSRLGSSVNDASPSTSDGRDAGVVERERDRLARERELGVGETLAERRLADPDDGGAVLDELRAHQPFHSGARRSRNEATPSPESCV